MADVSAARVYGAPSGVAEESIDLTPGVDVVYDGSSGILVGDVPGGAIEGWKVDNWGEFSSIIEVAASNRIEVVTAIAPTNRLLGDNKQLFTVQPGFYKDVQGNLDFQVKSYSPSPVEANKGLGIVVGTPDSATANLNYSTWRMILRGRRTTTNARLYDRICGNDQNRLLQSAPEQAWSSEMWMRIMRDGTDIKNYYKILDGDAWTERASVTGFGDTIGFIARMGIYFGGVTGGTPADTYYITRIVATSTPYTP